MSTLIQYSLEQIQSIYENNQFVLNNEVNNIFKHLEKLLPDEPMHTIPLIRSDRSFDRKNRNKRGRTMNRGYGSSGDILGDDWEAIRDFKPTEKKHVVGLDKEMNELRSYLNKMSNTNYTTQRNLIVDKIQSLFQNENMENEDKSKIVDNVFDICCSSKFLSELYADLYIELIGLDDVFGDKLDHFMVDYKNGLNNIRYIDPDEDYDGYCKYNQINELRKSNSLFIVNLMKRDMIEKQEFIDLILHMQNTCLEYISLVDKVHEVEEITENVFLLVTHSKEVLHTLEKWNDVNIHIKNFSSFKASDYASLSNRCRFKYMDM